MIEKIRKRSGIIPMTWIKSMKNRMDFKLWCCLAQMFMEKSDYI